MGGGAGGGGGGRDASEHSWYCLNSLTPSCLPSSLSLSLSPFPRSLPLCPSESLFPSLSPFSPKSLSLPQSPSLLVCFSLCLTLFLSFPKYLLVCFSLSVSLSPGLSLLCPSESLFLSLSSFSQVSLSLSLFLSPSPPFGSCKALAMGDTRVNVFHLSPTAGSSLKTAFFSSS